MSDKKPKLSGAENRKRRLAKETAALKNTQNIVTAFKNCQKSSTEGNISKITRIQLSVTVTGGKNANAMDLLNGIFKQDLENLMRNTVIALRIMLTMTVSVASGERAFSHLKINKNYLRNSMNEGRLSDLAIISIEHIISESINYDDIIEDFVNSKSRKKTFG